MLVSIVTPFGEKSFEMNEDAALALIHYAQQSAMPVATPAPPPSPQMVDALTYCAGFDAGKLEQSPEPHGDPEPPTAQGGDHRPSRVERMFGPRDTWDSKPEEPPEGYTGFLLLKCEECGEVKAFCAKYPTTQFRCDCGHRTDLHDLRPVYAHCKCGRRSKYRTNIEDDQSVVNCVECGAPIDLELNKDQSAYVTVGVRRGGGGTKHPYVFRPNQPLF